MQTGAAGDPTLTAAVDEAAMIRETRDRVRAEIPAPDRWSGFVTGGSFVLVVGAWLLLVPPASLSVAALFACVLAHAAASCLEFEIGPGSALPTTAVLVVALFLLPPQLVPVVVVTGLVTAAVIARLRDPSRRERLSVLAGSAWHSVGPAAVFALAGVHRPALGDAGIYAAALGAQLVLDAGSSWVRNCYGLGVPTRQLVGALRFTFLADLLLAPVGLAAALAVPGSPAALLFLVPPMLLLAMLQRDREQQISRAVLLGQAFVETADKARKDALTGLRNRLAWEEAIARSADAPSPIGVVLADVDDLKAANDLYGHEAGDRLLIAIAGLISGAVPDDGEAIAARLGGDEFGILLPDGLAERTEEVAQNLRRAIALTPTPAGRAAVSASVGYGLAPDGSYLGSAFLEADRRVYEDKARRRKKRR